MQVSRYITRLAGGILLALFIMSSKAQAQTVDGFSPEVVRLVAGMYVDLESIYKDIHSHPELGFEEVRTASRLAADMRALGFQVTEK